MYAMESKTQSYILKTDMSLTENPVTVHPMSYWKRSKPIRPLQDQYAYLTKTNDGRLLKSSTFYIKDESGTLAYIFSINYDITALAAANQFLQSFIQTQNPAEPSASRSATPQITHNVTELLDTLIEQAISNIGKPAALMTKDEKIKVVQYLNDAGAFLITKSGDKVASILGISKFTLYNYMDAGK